MKLPFETLDQKRDRFASYSDNPSSFLAGWDRALSERNHRFATTSFLTNLISFLANIYVTREFNKNNK